MHSALEALENLRAGNLRFVKGDESRCSLELRERRGELVAGQEPQAIILGCSDSRVPAELVLDQGLGELFVIRVAGNVAAPSQLGSVEFAAEQFGTRLVVVLGHSNCGAVLATLQLLRQPATAKDVSPNLAKIVDRIRSPLEPLLRGDPPADPDELVRAAIRANIRATAQRLRTESPILRDLHSDGLLVVGAEYSLETGAVDFFDGLPAVAASTDSR